MLFVSNHDYEQRIVGIELATSSV